MNFLSLQYDRNLYIKNFALRNHLCTEHTLKNQNELPTLVGVMTSEAPMPLGQGQFTSTRLNRELQKIGFPYKFYTVELNEQENILRFKKEIDDIKVFDIFDTFLGYSNIKEFGNKINCFENSVRAVLNGVRKQINGYKLKYNDIV